ncbi:MAG: putative prophage LambdaBa02, holin [Bryobacterales bacterium]|nr:putative prophage LambdaBa02, holin [Bryobacterales bacterium]
MLGVLKWYVAFGVGVWLQIPGLLRTLLVLMAMDYVSGLMIASLDGKLCARIGWRGLVKKVATLTLLLALHVAEAQAGFSAGLESICGIGFVVNELISLVQNFAVLGVPIPAPLMAALTAAKSVRAAVAQQREVDQLSQQTEARPPDPPA